MKNRRTALRILAGSVFLCISAAQLFAAAALYEPFDYPVGGLNGAGGTTEIGLTGTWNASADSLIASNSFAYGTLPTNGNSIAGLAIAMNRFGGARAVDPAALAANGWLADGAVLWFSVIMGVDTNANGTNVKLGFSLANDSFSTGKGNYWVIDDGTQLGSGLGVFMPSGKPEAAQFRDALWGDGSVGVVSGASTANSYSPGEHGLIVCKITWGATSSDPDTIELYQPGTDLAKPASPVSTLSVVVDQSTYDTITWARGDAPVMDEIRFGGSYNDVVGVDSSSDAVAPTPDPMTFSEAPVEASTNSIRMIASVADDLSGVEYYFACTNGGGNDSGWQSSRIYIDTGLTEGVTYTYTVKAHDLSTSSNETAASSGFSAVPQYVDETAPSPNPLTWENPPTAVATNEITMTATSATDENPVEYFFENMTTAGHDSGWQDSPTYIDTGLANYRSYSYRVKARDKAYLQNEGAWSEVSATVTFPPAGSSAALTEGAFFILGSQDSGGPDFKVSVAPDAAKFSGTFGANGPVDGYFGDGTVKDYCFFHERPANDNVIESYAAGAAGLISNGLVTADTDINNGSWADVWTVTDPGEAFSTAPDYSANTMFIDLSPSATGSINIADIPEGIVYFIYGAYRTTPAIDITMTGSGQSDLTLLALGDDDYANNNEVYLTSFGFSKASAYETINYSFNCSNGRFMGVVLWERPQPPSGTVLIIR